MNDQPPQGRATLPCRSGGREENGPLRERKVRGGADDHGVVASQFEQHPTEAFDNARADGAAHRGRARRGHERNARIGHELLAGFAAALNERNKAVRGVAEALQRASYQRHHDFGGDRCLLARLPDNRIPANQRKSCVPRPDGDRKVERADDQHRPKRMPLLHHAVAGPLTGDRETVELARETDCEVADVDHLLDLSEAFLDDLAAFQRYQTGEKLLRCPKLLTE